MWESLSLGHVREYSQQRSSASNTSAHPGDLNSTLTASTTTPDPVGHLKSGHSNVLGSEGQFNKLKLEGKHSYHLHMDNSQQ